MRGQISLIAIAFSIRALTASRQNDQISSAEVTNMALKAKIKLQKND